MELSKRVSRLLPSATLQAAAKAKALKESGVDVLSLINSRSSDCFYSKWRS